MPRGRVRTVTIRPLKYIFEDTTYFRILDFFLSKANDSYYGAPKIARGIDRSGDGPVRRCLQKMRDDYGIVIDDGEEPHTRYKLTDEYYDFLRAFQDWYLEWQEEQEDDS